MGNVDAIISLLSNNPDAFYDIQSNQIKLEELGHDFSSTLKKGEMRDIEPDNNWDLSFYCSRETHVRYGFESKSDFEHSLKDIFQLQLGDVSIQEGPQTLKVHLYNDRNGPKLSKRLVIEDGDDTIRFGFVFSDFFNKNNEGEYRNEIFDKISSSTDFLFSLCPQFNSKLHSLKKEKALPNSSIYTVHDFSELGGEFVIEFETLCLDMIHANTLGHTLTNFSNKDELFRSRINRFLKDTITEHPELPKWKTEAVLSNICVDVAHNFKQFRNEFRDKLEECKIQDRIWKVKSRPGAGEFGCCLGDERFDSPCWKIRGALQTRTHEKYWKSKIVQSYNNEFLRQDNEHRQNLYGIEVKNSAAKLESFDFEEAYNELDDFCITHKACDCECHVFSKNPRTWKHLHIYDSNISETDRRDDENFIPFKIQDDVRNFGMDLVDRHRIFNRKKAGLSINEVDRR